MGNSTKISPQLNETLKLIEKFGFSFFGYSETGDPLVVSPNSQIVTVKIAMNFVQDQIKKASLQAGSSSPEAISDIPTMPNMADKALEKGFEKNENKIEKSTNQKGHASIQTVQNQSIATSPKMKIDYPLINDFSDFGFKSSFKTLDQVQRFISRTAKNNNTSSASWLKELWNKFIEEMENK